MLTAVGGLPPAKVTTIDDALAVLRTYAAGGTPAGC